MTSTKTAVATTPAVPASLDVVLGGYKELLLAVPAPEQDGGASMIAAILDAQDISDLADDGSSLPKAEDMCGPRLRIDAITRHTSDEAFDDGTGFFLVVTAVNLDSGELVRWQTSATTVKAKLVKLFTMGWLPAIVQLSRSSKATSNGFYPINMNVISRA